MRVFLQRATVQVDHGMALQLHMQASLGSQRAFVVIQARFETFKQIEALKQGRADAQFSLRASRKHYARTLIMTLRSLTFDGGE